MLNIGFQQGNSNEYTQGNSNEYTQGNSNEHTQLRFMTN